MPKNIVIFSDGTGQEGGVGNNTNVYKLFNMVLDRSPEQIAFYDRGLGTGFRKLSGSIAGMGIAKNISECYRFIFDNYEAQDQIYLFGFSRGATTVRSLSSFVQHFGILPKSRPELIKKAYKIYKIGNYDKMKKAARRFIKRHHTMWTRVKFLGVWDTVAVLGLPIKSLDILIDRIPFLKHNYHNLRLSDAVENAYQALAIDDERKTFHPKIWDPEILSYQKIRQVWFCGMHTDVGGGYKEQGLSDLALDWMVRQAKNHGLKMYPNHQVVLTADSNGIMHNSRGSFFTKFYRKKPRIWPHETHGVPVVHESVVQRVRGRDNKESTPYKPWILDMDVEPEIEV